jgi:hypothetical protein
MDIPAAASGTIGVGEGVGNACNTGLINSKISKFFSFFQIVVRLVPVEIQAPIADCLLGVIVILEFGAASAACLSHCHSPSMFGYRV